MKYLVLSTAFDSHSSRGETAGVSLSHTMWRRINFSFPSAEQARWVAAELETAGVERDRIHAIARQNVDIAGLPGANDAQRSDHI